MDQYIHTHTHLMALLRDYPMCRLAFMVLHKLAILSQQVIMIECVSLVLIVFGRSFECRHVFYISIIMDQYIHTYTHLMALLP